MTHTQYNSERDYDEDRTFLESNDSTKHSRAPWSYEYSPYFMNELAFAASGKTDPEIPAFVVWDANGVKVFDTNKNTPPEKQERNARLAVAAPKFLRLLKECASLLADHEDSKGQEGRLYRRVMAAVEQAS